MSDELKLKTCDEPSVPKRTKSRKPESTKIKIVNRTLQGQSQRKIAREVGIHREAVKNIIEEANIPAQMARNGLTNDFFDGHLKRLVTAQKKTLYGFTDDTSAQVKAVNIGYKLNGAFKHADAVADKNRGDRPSTHSLSLVFTDERRAREFVEAIAARRSAGGVIELDATVDKDLG